MFESAQCYWVENDDVLVALGVERKVDYKIEKRYGKRWL